MRRTIACFIAFGACAVFGQSPSSPPFEVASVRTVLPGGTGRRVTGGPGTDDPTRFDCLGSMWAILQIAFGVKDDRFEHLPEWARQRKFEIEAKLPLGTSKEQLQQMLQNLLRERFGLAFHMTKHEIDAYTLVVAKGGLKLKPAAPPNGPLPDDVDAHYARAVDQNGFPKLAPGYSAWARTGATTTTGAIRITVKKSSPAVLVAAIGRGVVEISDKTGLTGPYDFTLEYDPESVIALVQSDIRLPAISPERSNAPDIFSALEKQLGLKLETGKAQVDVVAIDHLDEVPTDN